MAAINDAYRILGDPRRRAVYDAALASPPTTRAAPDAGDAAEPDPVRRFDPLARYQLRPRYPWKAVLVLAAVATVLVFAASALRGEPRQPAPDNLLRPGSCVALDANGDAREVACASGSGLVVERLVPFDGDCPDGTEPHRDRQGMGVACITAASPSG
jgi:molecular chaperone DnaJ